MPKKGYADVVDRDPTKVPLEEKIGRNKEKLGESDRRSLQLQVAEDEESIRAAAELSSPPDLSDTKQRLVRNKMILGRDDELTPKSDTAKDRLAARARDIERTLKANMPTKREMWPKSGSPESQRAIQHNMRFQEQYSPLCREWQDIQKKLNPDDPYAQSLELIRPD